MISSLDETEKAAEVIKSSLKRQRIDNTIFFSNDDVKRVQTPHNETVVISMTIAKYDVKRILVDNGSSTDILFYDSF